MTIKKNIQALCKEKGITMKELEERCGLAHGTILRWGKDGNPTVMNLRKVADFFGTGLDELVNGKEKSAAGSSLHIDRLIDYTDVMERKYQIYCKPVVTPAEIAFLLDLSVGRVKKMLANEKIPAYGEDKFYLLEDAVEYFRLEANRKIIMENRHQLVECLGASAHRQVTDWIKQP